MTMPSEVSQLDETTYYSTLGLLSNASSSEIRKAYMLLAKELHPDKSKSSRSEDLFKVVSHAHSVLMDPIQKLEYDMELKEAGLFAYVPQRIVRNSTEVTKDKTDAVKTPQIHIEQKPIPKEPEIIHHVNNKRRPDIDIHSENSNTDNFHIRKAKPYEEQPYGFGVPDNNTNHINPQSNNNNNKQEDGLNHEKIRNEKRYPLSSKRVPNVILEEIEDEEFKKQRKNPTHDETPNSNRNDVPSKSTPMNVPNHKFSNNTRERGPSQRATPPPTIESGNIDWHWKEIKNVLQNIIDGGDTNTETQTKGATPGHHDSQPLNNSLPNKNDNNFNMQGFQSALSGMPDMNTQSNNNSQFPPVPYPRTNMHNEQDLNIYMEELQSYLTQCANTKISLLNQLTEHAQLESANVPQMATSEHINEWHDFQRNDQLITASILELQALQFTATQRYNAIVLSRKSII